MGGEGWDSEGSTRHELFLEELSLLVMMKNKQQEF